jgi:hypothetical protein
LADKLVKVWKLNGVETWVLVHIEIQSQEEGKFGERMFVYYYRLRDKYDLHIASLAILGDERETWRPQPFESALWGCRVQFEFPIVKLLDWILELPEGLKQSFRDELEEYEREQQMPYVTSIERMGIEQGRDSERKTIAVNMLRKNIPLETISEVTGLSIDRLQELQSNDINDL